jgi:hypothetical protein
MPERSGFLVGDDQKDFVAGLVRVPQRSVSMLTAYSSTETAVEDLKQGVYKLPQQAHRPPGALPGGGEGPGTQAVFWKRELPPARPDYAQAFDQSKLV